ncbi:DNA-directed RNA polymerase sigma-70 factor [Plantactinospora endophytica]|uniref:DNA-directed RNA polymerase sigma-70 factor n=1 Tax=Plantactinospora endophytica TaxID=673535 RepID=A0ABQ4DSY5_9ACTN|nr:DNA-directed RNA polymerase sigma-70 factor [Plantactinospora endophytica]
MVQTSAPAEPTFDAVYAAQYDPLVRLAYVTTGSRPAAEDLVQEVFVEWLRRRDDVREPVPYLRRAVVSRSTSWLRRRILERRYGDTEAPPPEQSAPPDGTTTAVRAALARLKPRQRSVVFLRYYLDLPVDEIASALGCRPGTVKSLLHRSLAVLQEHLDDD